MSRKIEVYTGKFVDPLDLRVEDVVLEDLFHMLAMKCRFSGAVRKFYSVASHSVLVSRHPKVVELGARWRMAALLHDAHEAYLTDVPSPVKPYLLVSDYPEDMGDMPYPWRDVESAAQWAIHDAVGDLLPSGLRSQDSEGTTDATLTGLRAIKHADLVALLAEAQVLMPSKGEELEGGEWSLPVEVWGDPWLDSARAFVRAACDGPGLFPCPNNSPAVAIAEEFRTIRKEIVSG